MSFQSKQESPGKRFLEKLSANLSRKKANSPGDLLTTNLITTQLSHQILILLGTAFVLFEIMFLTCYATDFWFACDLSFLGLPAIIASIVLAHCLLSWLESAAGCRFASAVCNGTSLLSSIGKTSSKHALKRFCSN
jgi:hypothetical protein